jgi:hypothetical protein
MSATSSRRLELVSDLRPNNRGNRYGQTISTCQDGLSVRRACLELVGLLDAMEFSHAHDTRNFWAPVVVVQSEYVSLMTSSADVTLVLGIDVYENKGGFDF